MLFGTLKKVNPLYLQLQAMKSYKTQSALVMKRRYGAEEIWKEGGRLNQLK